MKTLNTFKTLVLCSVLFSLLRTEVHSQKNELVVIDKAISNSGILADCMKNGLDVVVLGNNGNQLEDLTREIESRNNLDAIHLFFCGKDGILMMEGVMLSNNNLTNHLETFGKWKTSFKPGADMMIYTCNLAESNEGKGLIRRMAAYTGLDVAASVNHMGNISGDWSLEFRKGDIESDYCFTSGIGNYPGTFKREIPE